MQQSKFKQHMISGDYFTIIGYNDGDLDCDFTQFNLASVV